MKLVSYAERPDLLARREGLGAAWDEFMYHDAVANRYWERQYDEFPDLQHFLVDEDDRLLAESNAVPIPFGPEALPDEGWDAVNLRRAYLLWNGATELPILPPKAFRTNRRSTRMGPKPA